MPAKRKEKRKEASRSSTRATKATPRSRAPCLAALSAGEAAEVLSRLLEQHPDLRGEAEVLARELLGGDVDFEAGAEELVDALESLDPHEVGDRAGCRPEGGYVEPGEAALEILNEAFAPYLAEIERLVKLRLREAAEGTVRGVVVGLHRLDEVPRPTTDSVLSWVEEWPIEAAAEALETWRRAKAKLAGKRHTRARGARVPPWTASFARRHLPRWQEQLGR